MSKKHRKRELLTPAMLKSLSQHTYQSLDTSPLDLHVMQRFWNLVTDWLPVWLAPNVITLTALLINTAATLLLIGYCPNLEGEAPRYVYLLCALAVFAYQTLDAIDGKQARRTGSGSPLGELFDHGCDAFTTPMLMCGAVATCQLGPTSLSVWAVLMSTVAYYTCHWEAFVTGRVHFGWMDVTEGQFAVIAVHTMTWALGTSIWYWPVIGQWQLRHVACLISIVAPAGSVLRNLHVIIVQNERPTLAQTSILQPLCAPGAILVMLHYLCVHGCVSGGEEGSLYTTYPAVVLLTFGCALAKMSLWLVVACMTRHPHKYWEKAMTALFLLCLNARYCIVNQSAALFGVALYTQCSFFLLFARLTQQAAAKLGLPLFSIAYPNKAMAK